MSRALSPTQQAAVELMRARGGRLYRWRGGYWSPIAAPAVPSVEKPSPYVGTNTVNALRAREVVFVAAYNALGGYPVEVVLVEERRP